MTAKPKKSAENIAAQEFKAIVEPVNSTDADSSKKRLVITRGYHSESVVIHQEEAQSAIIALVHAFPGIFSDLLEASWPFADLLENEYEEGEMLNLEIDGGDVTKLKHAMVAIEREAFNQLNPNIKRDQPHDELETQQVSEDCPIIDLDALAWSQIKESANQSEWIPEQYCMNEWVSDVCNFLRTSVPVKQPSVALPARKSTSLTDDFSTGFNACRDEVDMLNVNIATTNNH